MLKSQDTATPGPLASLVDSSWAGGCGPHYNGVYEETPPKKGVPVFRLKAYERVEISQVEVHERVGRPVIKVQRELRTLLNVAPW